MSNVRQFFITEPNCPVTTGSIIPMPYEQVERVGYLFCDGTTFSTTGDYSLLFSVIGYTYGGSGGYFQIPDLRGQYIRGWGGNAAALGVYQADEFQSHRHTFWRGDSGTTNTYQVAAGGTGRYNTTINDSGDYNQPANNETRPRNISVRWAIRYI